MTAARHLYGALLYLFPGQFRRVHAGDMRATFDARLERLAASPLPELASFCAVNFVDVAASAGFEWMHRARHADLTGESRRWSMAAREATAVVLAITIGVCGAALPWSYDSLDSPLPFHDASRLVRLGERSPALRTEYVSPLTFDDWRTHGDGFDDLAAFRHWEHVPLEDGHGAAETVTHVASTANFFNLLGVQPMLGRTFRDEQRPVGSEAVISHAFWQTHYNADPGIVGRVIALRGFETTVVGVLPPMSPGLEVGWGDIWTCLYRYDVAQQRASGYRGRYLTVVGRLAAGVSIDAARRRIEDVQRRLSADPMSVAGGFRATLEPLRHDNDSARAVAFAVFGAAGVAMLSTLGFGVLRIVATRRRTPPKNAPGWRLVVTTVAIGVLALSITRHTMSLILPGGFESGGSVIPVAALCLLSSLILWRGHGRPRSRARRRPPSQASQGAWVWNGLATAQLALAVLIVACTSLVWRSVTALDRVDPGFDTLRAWSFDVFLPASRYPTEADYTRFVRDIVGDLRNRPMTASVGSLLYFPQRPKVWPTPIWTRDDHGTPGSESGAYFNLIAGDALAAMGTALTTGRLPTAAETFEQAPIAVINRALAAALFPTGNVLGQHVRTDVNGPWLEVIGVVENMRQQRQDLPGEPEVFVPFWTMPMPFMTFVVRSTDDDANVASEIRRVLSRRDPRLPLAELSPLNTSTRAATADRRFVLALLVILAAIVVTTVAVTAYEIGRGAVAQGLTRTAATRRAAVGVLTVVLPGLALGAAAIPSALRWTRPLLFGVGPTDPFIHGVAAAVLGITVVAVSAAAGLGLKPSVRTAV